MYIKPLRKLHNHLIHRSRGKLFLLLKKAYPEQVSSDIINAPDNNSTACEICNELQFHHLGGDLVRLFR